MNKFSKICVGTLCAIVEVGSIEGIYYKEIPALKNTVNNFFKNNAMSNISIDKPPINNNEDKNTVKLLH